MKENEKENENEKINQLIVELSESREDERNTQNQILQIISIMGTVLGLLFGASYLSDKSDKNIEFKNLAFLSQKYFFNFQPIIITPARVIFWLSALSFLVAFFYITYLGIENTLRYYHIKNIEERLYILIPEVKDNDHRGAFLHWNEFIAPIMTKNPKHIASSHTALSFFTYIGAIICIIIFSMSITLKQYLPGSQKSADFPYTPKRIFYELA